VDVAVADGRDDAWSLLFAEIGRIAGMIPLLSFAILAASVLYSSAAVTQNSE
jgi:hypothetical protein